ncbi:putative NRPS-like enzyme [Cadophora sp. DSE1049]|nr:putative NRPS-like enzyme [Cadophora sp. DSE1049]
MAPTNSNHSVSYGRRLMPIVLDDVAAIDPTRVFAAIPKSANISDGFRDVSYSEVANATNKMARWLQETFGSTPERDFETLTYIGVSDLRYSIAQYAAIKCGYKLLFPSPRNPVATNLSLMDQTQSSKLLYCQELAPLIHDITSTRSDIRVTALQSQETLLAAPHDPFPYAKSFNDGVDDPIVVLHSSGSTGIPKPVVMTNGSFAVHDNDRNFPQVEGRTNYDLTIWDFHGKIQRTYSPFPLFHLGGFLYQIMLPIYTNSIPVYGPPLSPPTAALITEILERQDIRGSMMPPSLVEQLLHEPKSLAHLKKLKFLLYAGGPLSETAGDEMSKYTMLGQFYGSTETGPIKQLAPLPGDWAWIHIHPDVKLRFEPSADDAYELVLLMDETTRDNMALNHNFPDLEEWRTKDLFRRHPVKPDLWRFHGRNDDIVVLSNGEKFYPVPMETTLQAHPMIAGALVTGTRRFQPALVVELNLDAKNDPQALEKIWPAVEDANTAAPGQGRVTKSKIIISNSKKPFVRSGKGTIVRRLTEVLYAEEIDSIYAKKEETPGNTPEIVLQAASFQPDNIRSFVRQVVTQSLARFDIGDADNFYSYGLDSLQTIEAVKLLKSGLDGHRDASQLAWISPSTFYKHPSIVELADALLLFLTQGAVPGEQLRTTKMTEIYEKMIKSLPKSQSPATTSTSEQVCIAITGTTGSFGAVALSEILQSDSVSRVFCLNRSAKAKQNWLSKQESQDRDTARITFLTVDMALPNLGLSNAEFQDLSANCDLVLHNAWKVDFNQTVSSFEDNIKSVLNFVALSAGSQRRPRIAFTSSLSSVGPWVRSGQISRTVPEDSVSDLDTALDMGYSESKKLAERILDTAAAYCQVPISVLRVGQICGSTRPGGSPWSSREVVPGIIQTSKSIGLVPNDLQQVDWIPIDTLASITLELSLHDLKSGILGKPSYHNVVNPHKTPWSDLVPCIKEYCGPEARSVPLTEWIEVLRELDTTSPKELESKPALKVMPFFSLIASRGSQVTFETATSEKASRSMSELKAIDVGLVKMWLNDLA